MKRTDIEKILDCSPLLQKKILDGISIYYKGDFEIKLFDESMVILNSCIWLEIKYKSISEISDMLNLRIKLKNSSDVIAMLTRIDKDIYVRIGHPDQLELF